jgi:uncharacterized repeat protein (TIGR03847 family)
MADALHDFGPIDEMKPEAIGLPGNRRFRLLFRAGSRVACFWMEKQQLGALADAVNELLSQAEGGEGRQDPTPTGHFPEPFEIEAQAGRLALGYNEASDLFLIFLYDIETELNLLENAQSEEEAEDATANAVPTIRTEVTRGQLERFYGEAATVINAGRPQKPSRNGHIPYQPPQDS